MKRNSRHHGVIFILALGITVVLGIFVLVFAQEMRTELTASANRVASAQADAVELAAEQWVLANVEAYAPDAVTITQLPAAGVPVGGGYFWLLSPNPDQNTDYNFGIVDETGKLNLNAATSPQMMMLPGMTQDVSDSIADWVDTDDNPHSEGAESDYYESLPEAYYAKNAPMDTIEELFLVKGMTTDLLYGYDFNHNGVIEPGEQPSSNFDSTSAGFSSTGDVSRGIFNYVTIHTIQPNKAADGTTRVNVNSASLNQIRNVLTTHLGGSTTSSKTSTTNNKTNTQSTNNRVNQIVTLLNTYIRNSRTPANRFASIGDFYTTSTMTPAEIANVADYFTTSSGRTVRGVMNVNTASREALACLPGMTSSDADAIVAARSGTNSNDMTFALTAVSASAAAQIAGSITTRSYQYSADIVATSGDGRAYRRVRIVVDAQSTPAKIIYRKDLTSLGWPLGSDIKSQLKSGQGIVYQAGIQNMGSQ